MVRLLICAFLMIWSTAAFAWDPAGHQVVGSIADQLLLNTNAGQQVAQILGYDLKTAGPWLDCVKSVVKQDDAGTFVYTVNKNYEPPCTPFTNDHKIMTDYVQRNWNDCKYPATGVDAGCHNTYHFDDVAIQRNTFDRNFQGTNDHDIVAAINAAIAVLRGRPAPHPFLLNRQEALFLLAHLLGDLHQPLHVAAVYLAPDGSLVDPDTNHTIDPASDTAGGNTIRDLKATPVFGNQTFHIADWDTIPLDLENAPVATPALIAMAQAIPADSGKAEDWSVIWATDTIQVAPKAFAGVQFTSDPDPDHKGWWLTSFTDRDAYMRAADDLKRQQLAKGGARLAELLKAIWP